MKRIILFCLVLGPATAFAQNYVNQAPGQGSYGTNINPQQQVQVNASNVQANDDDIQQQADNNPGQQENDSCPDCLKIKELQKQQLGKPVHNDFVPQKVRRHKVKKFYHRCAKKMKKAFSRSKKTRPDYSCFKW